MAGSAGIPVRSEMPASGSGVGVGAGVALGVGEGVGVGAIDGLTLGTAAGTTATGEVLGWEEPQAATMTRLNPAAIHGRRLRGRRGRGVMDIVS